MFKKVFPSKTAGDGSPMFYAVNRGEGQGVKSPGFDVKCKQCGFVVDISVTIHKGGSKDCNGGYGEFSTDEYGIKSREVKKGGGCPSCGSRNII